jgi:DNA topoisomerase-1
VPDDFHVLAGDCTTTFSGREERTVRGRVVVLAKPDGTVLVHDADGYQPVAWLTRADGVTVEADGDAFGVTAREGDRRLRTVSHDFAGRATFPATAAGPEVGACPDCGGALVRADGAVGCLGCERAHGLPAGATTLDRTCPDCGLPLVRAVRGAPFEVCLDRDCDPLVERVRERFGGAWDCPDCGAPLAVLERGGLLAACSAHPDCETAFSLPAGEVVDDCPCGLPVFETPAGRRCLDGTCDRLG